MTYSLLQDKWNPSSAICLINCIVTGDQLKAGLAWFKGQILEEFITVTDQTKQNRIDVIVPHELRKKESSTILINITLEIIK